MLIDVYINARDNVGYTYTMKDYSGVDLVVLLKVGGAAAGRMKRGERLVNGKVSKFKIYQNTILIPTLVGLTELQVSDHTYLPVPYLYLSR